MRPDVSQELHDRYMENNEMIRKRESGKSDRSENPLPSRTGSMIEISNLVKMYGNKAALNDVSFSVGHGEVVGFLGPNGAGKSTTMNIITGYLSSTGGTVKVGGIDVLEHPAEAKKLIGFLPEQPPLYLDMTVNEYLGFVFEIKKCKLDKKKHLAEVRALTKTEDVKNRVIKNLSKGYRQRVGIAQALVGDPPVIIFDEPTVGLDPKQIIEIRNMIRSLGKNHTVVLSTHILSEVQAVCDRVVIINDGKIIADEKTERLSDAAKENRRCVFTICGPRKDVLRELSAIPGVLSVDLTGGRELDGYAYLVESDRGVDIRKPVFFAMCEKGRALIGVQPLGVDLEEVFIKLTDTNRPKQER